MLAPFLLESHPREPPIAARTGAESSNNSLHTDKTRDISLIQLLPYRTSSSPIPEEGERKKRPLIYPLSLQCLLSTHCDLNKRETLPSWCFQTIHIKLHYQRCWMALRAGEGKQGSTGHRPSWTSSLTYILALPWYKRHTHSVYSSAYRWGYIRINLP